MASHQYITLLRGINVGGNNIIKMTDLKSCFESMGFSDVVTFIQSGNVLFKTPRHESKQVIRIIERGLSEQYNYNSRIILLKHQQLKKVVDGAPQGYGKDGDKYKYDVLFLKESLAPVDILKELMIKKGVDEAFAGEHVLYFIRLIERASQSKLTKIVTLPFYQDITIRNWNTTTKLLELSEKE